MIMSNKQLEEIIFGIETQPQSELRDEFLERIRSVGILEFLHCIDEDFDSVRKRFHTLGNHVTELLMEVDKLKVQNSKLEAAIKALEISKSK